ncbi:hypothetical protein [Thalassospira marina]|uniref:hypothetical protein n=1 Tax=Thalassospira marina TaxID=2048283 RepID=UPI0012FF43F0|nr:hypothetical protein [Thalassospira marina]
MLYIVQKALDELEAMPRDERESYSHMDREISEAVEKLQQLKAKLETDEKK